MARTLFEKYGGFGTISKIVMAFYDKVLSSEQIGPFFDDIDMSRQIDHQTKFISQIMGGPASYTDEALRQVHAHLQISQSDFDEMARLLEETLEDFDFAPADINTVMKEIRGRSPYVVNV